MAKVFISYAREDFDAAKRLFDQLRSNGHDAWLDKECLLPGQRWRNAIEAAIRDSHYFVALLSPNSVAKRGYVQKELRLGLDVLDEFPDTTIFLIPVRIAQCEPTHEQLRELQWLDLFPDWDAGYSRLIKVIGFAPSKEPATIKLSGTTWLATQRGYTDWRFLLRGDGIVEYDQLDSGSHFDNGTWTLDGVELYIEFNRKFAQYRGKVVGNRITGVAQNVNGAEWKWEAVREG